MPAIVKEFEFVVEAFVCYPTQNQVLQSQFIELLKVFRQMLNDEQWRQYLSRPVFLPATSNKINSLVA